MTTKHPFPDCLKVRDTKVTADEGQRIYSTATGYGYEWCEYVRADLAARAALGWWPAMSTELVDRLRDGPIRTGDTENGEYELFDIEDASEAMYEAAAELTALAAKVALLSEALAPFAREADARANLALGPDIDHWSIGSSALTLGDIRRARHALSEEGML